jgi:hypothetical protein
MVAKSLAPSMTPSPVPFAVTTNSPALPLSPALVPTQASVEVVNGGYGIKNPFLAISNSMPKEKPAQELGMYKYM